MVDCNADDVLGTIRDVNHIHRWYTRLADLSARQPVTGGSTPLSAVFMRRYLAPGSTPTPMRWEAPQYLRAQFFMDDAVDHHRAVYLSEERTRDQRWGGVRPRFLRVPRQHRRNHFVYQMHYESLVAPPPGMTVWGTPDQKDIAVGLGTGWQLRSEVTVTVTLARGVRNAFEVDFTLVQLSVKDTYDFDPTKHHRMPNPDSGSSSADAICPANGQLVVYHRNAIRMERAGLAEAYRHESYPWTVRWAPGRTSASNPIFTLPGNPL